MDRRRARKLKKFRREKAGWEEASKIISNRYRPSETVDAVQALLKVCGSNQTGFGDRGIDAETIEKLSQISNKYGIDIRPKDKTIGSYYAYSKYQYDKVAQQCSKAEDENSRAASAFGGYAVFTLGLLGVLSLCAYSINVNGSKLKANQQLPVVSQTQAESTVSKKLLDKEEVKEDKPAVEPTIPQSNASSVEKDNSSVSSVPEPEVAESNDELKETDTSESKYVDPNSAIMLMVMMNNDVSVPEIESKLGISLRNSSNYYDNKHTYSGCTRISCSTPLEIAGYDGDIYIVYKTLTNEDANGNWRDFTERSWTASIDNFTASKFQAIVNAISSNIGEQCIYYDADASFYYANWKDCEVTCNIDASGTGKCVFEFESQERE